jgi:hypothetical protein
MRGVNVGAVSDDLLWEYITGAVDENALYSYAFDSSCDASSMYSGRVAGWPTAW